MVENAKSNFPHGLRCFIMTMKTEKSVVFVFIRVLSIHDDDGNKIAKNLHLTMKNRVLLERFLFMYISHTCMRREMTCFVVVWTKISRVETKWFDLSIHPFPPNYSLFKLCLVAEGRCLLLLLRIRSPQLQILGFPIANAY